MSDDVAVIPARGRDILGRRASGDRDPKVRLYDFRRPDKFSKEQIRTVEIVHETFARLSCTSLSAQLRLPCDMGLKLVDQLTYQEFTDTLSAPTVLGAFTAKPWEGMALFHFDTELREALLERSFGGVVGPVDPVIASRELTDLEHSVLGGIIRLLLGNFGRAWEQVEKLEPELRTIETDPRFCQIVPPTEMVLLVGFEVRISGRVGRLNLVIPYILIEPVVFKLNAEYWYTREHQAVAGRLAPAIARAVQAPVELIVAGGRLSIGELRSLRKGSLVPVPGLDEGIGRLRTGGCEVARLRMAEPRRDGRLELEVLPDAADDGADPGETDATAGSTSLERSLGGIERGFAGLKESLEDGMKRLGTRLDEIEGSQESFADRLAFGGADEAASEARDAEKRPFSSLAAISAEHLSLFFAVERAQATALVLAWLDDAQASRVLDGLKPELQTEVVRRLANLDWVSPGVMKEMDRVLSRKLAAIGKDHFAPGGIPKVVGLLNLTQRATEKNVIESLDRIDPALSEEIKKNMFVFEDISLLDGESIALLLERVDEGDIVLALKPLDKAMREKVLARFEKSAATRLLARAGALGRVRLSECDAAGQRVVAIVRRLDEEGLMGIQRPGEEA